MDNVAYVEDIMISQMVTVILQVKILYALVETKAENAHHVTIHKNTI